MIYFLPTIIALRSNISGLGKLTVFLLNLFFGWTLIV
ncbi:MAG: superinfection immunity protein [Nanoarchaeota archaeon]